MGRYRPPGVYAQEEVRSIAPSPIPNADVIAIVSEVPAAAPYAERITLDGTAAVQLQKKGIVGASIKIFSRDESVEYDSTAHFTVTSSGANDYTSFKSIARIERSVTDESFTLDTGRNFHIIGTVNDVTDPDKGVGVHNIVVRTPAVGEIPERTYEKFVDYLYDPNTNKLIATEDGSLPRDGSQILVSYNYGIADDEDVLVTYEYADDEYYSHRLLQDESEIYAFFGYPWKADGTPNPMSLAAWLAFTNGGPQTQVLCIPVNPHSVVLERTEVTEVEWQEAFDSIVENEVSLVCETSGTLANHGKLIAHVLGASQYNQERIGIIGRDGVADPTVDRATLQGAARAINNKRIVHVSPSRWETVEIVNGEVAEIGGQYAAAAFAGKLTLYNPQETMTRKNIANIRTKGPEAEPLLTGDTAAGLLVIENKSGFMRVRHSITTAFTDINQRELNVVRAQDFMIKSMREVLDRTVIGMLMEPNVDFLVQGAATNILDRMKNSFVIADYQTPQVFQDTTDPTRLRLRFEYRPNYPVNEIVIEFSLTPFGARSEVA